MSPSLPPPGPEVLTVLAPYPFEYAPEEGFTSIAAEPLKETPLIALAVWRVVAVVELPVNAAVIVPAVKFPEASLATIADAVFAEVALEVTVNVAAPELLNVVEPVRPVPEVFKVSVFARFPPKDVAVNIPVDGLNESFVVETLELVMVPVVVWVNTG